MEEEAADDSRDISLEQAVLRLAEEAGKAEGSEGQRIVQKDLCGMHHIGAVGSLMTVAITVARAMATPEKTICLMVMELLFIKKPPW